MTENEVTMPQTLAMFECGESRGEIHFKTYKEDNEIYSTGGDALYYYRADPSDVICHGTVFIRNKKTGEYKAIPVSNFVQISRHCKIQNYEKIQSADTASLVNKFGTRQAKRIYNMRSNAVNQ